MIIISKNNHPRGMLGKTHTAEVKKQTSERNKKLWSDPNSRFNSEEHKQIQSDNMHKIMIEKFSKRNSNYSRCRGGKRLDLNSKYFRSSWEANYARYLNFLIKHNQLYKWEYEADTFVFEAIKRGTRSYIPDFKIWDTVE